MQGSLLLLLLGFFLQSFSGFSQKNQLTTFGIQFKPIISSEIINTGTQVLESNGIKFSIKPNLGYNFGMVVRQSFNKQISLESGINYSKRNYQLSIENTSNGFVGNSSFSYVVYEIPVLALIYVQLGERVFMNNAFGLSMNFLPSDWDSFDTYFLHYSERNSWLVPSLLANVGAEYRTYDKGAIYLGFSYHRPFTKISTAGVLYRENGLEKARAFFDISGNYLTLDIRYFFHEDPEYKQKRKKK